MKYLTVNTVIELHRQLIEAFGGISGIRDIGALQGALSRPLTTFDGQDLYPTLWHKAAALAHGIAHNHPFLDGNKRTAQITMETFLNLNGWDVTATTKAQETIFLQLADGKISADELAQWLILHTAPLPKQHRSSQ